MAGYVGSASFDFEIERYKDKSSGELIAAVPGRNETAAILADDGFEYEYVILPLKVEGRSYFQPGRFYGPPENCYPDESETEITSVIGPDGKDWYNLLTSEEKEMITFMIQEYVMDDCEPDYDDYGL